VSAVAISCGLLSCAGAADDAGDGAENVEAETPEPDAPEPNAAAVPEPEAPEPAASAPEPDAPEPNATLEPDEPSPEPQAQPNGTPDAPEPDAPTPAQGGTTGIGEGTAGSTANGGAAGAQEQPSPAVGGSAAGGSGGVEGPAGAGGTDGSPVVESISFTRVEEEVFEPAGCTAGYCHGGSAGDLTWSYEELVGTAAAEPVCGLTERVVPGDPEASILWQRVRPLAAEETESCAEMMPKGGPPLDAAQAQLVYDWIAGGAAP
jgi:hypothetical protein